MCLSRSIVLNNSLLFNYLILGSFSYCDFPSTSTRPLLITLRRIHLGQRLGRLCLPKL